MQEKGAGGDGLVVYVDWKKEPYLSENNQPYPEPFKNRATRRAERKKKSK